MDTFDFIEMKVPAKPEYVGVIRLSLSGIANRMGFSYETIEDLKIAISEAVTNVVSHAYNDESGEVGLGFGVYPDRLEVMVADRGQSFNLKEIRKKIGPFDEQEQDMPITELREGGFGLLLINTLMDKVEINNEYGVIVLMTKYVDEAEVDVNDQVKTR